MSRDELSDRITEQFSNRTERSDMWRVLDLVLDTSAYLNLGFSPRYHPTLLGSSQRRLVAMVGSIVQSQLSSASTASVLDIGCGRGGPAQYFADHYGVTVVGIDLVPYNIRCAQRTTALVADRAVFVVGDAEQLPIKPGTMRAVVAIDSIVYFPRKIQVFAELSRVLERDGVLVLSDLVCHSSVTDSERHELDRFADEWDMPAICSLDRYVRALVDGGFDVHDIIDITPNSIGRFRKWTALYRVVVTSPAGRILEWVLRKNSVQPAVIHNQIDRAHHALPSLRHVIVVATPAYPDPA